MRISVPLFRSLLALVLVASFMPSALSQEGSMPGESVANLDRYGSPSTVNVDRYGSPSIYDIEKYSHIKPIYDVGLYSNIKPLFNVSQRGGLRSVQGYSYSISAQSPAYIGPVYDVSTLSRKLPVYSVGQHSRAGEGVSVGGSKVPLRLGAAMSHM